MSRRDLENIQRKKKSVRERRKKHRDLVTDTQLLQKSSWRKKEEARIEE